ncbi:aldehyde ferredoxin oxidoreductase family protein [Chloroflexota bacterium]
MDGWVGNILRVDLTQADYSVEPLDPDLAESFIGGRGLGTKLLFDEIDPEIDPLSPENKLIFATGVLSGTGVVASSRYMVVTKSPLTGAIASPNSGGFFSAELKFAGYDIIIFEGKSPEPVYLSIENDDVQIKPAKHLWGKSVSETEAMIKAETADEWKAKETQVACIGPAGENLVRMACVMHSGHAAARNGTGAVMGSKNLKAVAVRGTKGISVADGDGLREAIVALLDTKVRGTKRYTDRVAYGTLTIPENGQATGQLATRNFQEGYFEGLELEWTKERWASEFRVGTHSCFACQFATHKVTRVTDPEYQGCGIGPEHESFTALGPCCGISNVAAIHKANYECNELGMDTIDTGHSIACAMDLYERGFLPEKDAGYKLNFGNAKAMVELVESIGLRQGFGDILAEGGYRMAERYGHAELFMGVKKQAFAVWHPQPDQSRGLAYATNNCGASHTKGGGGLGNETEDVEAYVKRSQDWIATLDSCGLCWSMWRGNPFTDEDLPPLLELVTGITYTLDDLLLIGERIWNLERIFNLKAGITADDDTLPRRMSEEPMPKGPSAGAVSKISEMLPEYYELRGWDKNGVPPPEKLAELSLTWEGD